MPEYCAGFGIPFTGPADFEDALERLIADYSAHAARMPAYPQTAERMISEWIALFDSLVQDRAELIARRKLWRSPLTLLQNQVF